MFQTTNKCIYIIIYIYNILLHDINLNISKQPGPWREPSPSPAAEQPGGGPLDDTTGDLGSVEGRHMGMQTSWDKYAIYPYLVFKKHLEVS